MSEIRLENVRRSLNDKFVVGVWIGSNLSLIGFQLSNENDAARRKTPY